MDWTDEEDAELRRLWDDGKSASQIAEELPERTRNAVIARAHRLGLAARRSPIQGKTLAPKTKKRKAKPNKPTKTRTFNAPRKKFIGALGIMGRAAGPVVNDLVHSAETPFERRQDVPRVPRGTVQRPPSEFNTCQYPYGERLNWSHCGAKTVNGLPYCEEHAARCYRSPHESAIGTGAAGAVLNEPTPRS